MIENRYSDKQKFWMKMIQRWEELGRISASVFCREYNLDKSQFNYWRNKYAGDEHTDEIQLVQVMVGKSKPESYGEVEACRPASLMRVSFGGFTVEVEEDFNAQSLEKLVGVLRGVAC